MSEVAQTSAPTEFTGNASSLRNTIWIGSDDIERPVRLKLAAVVVFDTVVWPHGRIGNNVPALAFEGTNKFLHLCAESRVELQNAWGKKVVEWKGKTVELYVKDNVRLGKKITTGVRARPVVE